MAERENKIKILRIDRLGENFTLVGMATEIKKFFQENGQLPDIIELHIDDFIRYPLFFKDGGWLMQNMKVYGIPIRPYK
jgi:hypothetical protein